ncbi:MAG: hypothetical protein JSU63_12480 [Phycisphaerales bacterium]|nr:MAG: hypothetical protein JSU63_12480 [Phycisphaerales bacterium]
MSVKQPHPNIRFVMLGGFLGAGKTTALLRLAQRYVDTGLRVGIVTNDQGEELVDTATFRTAGYATEEIPKGCFCRRLDELLAAAGRLQDGHRPDVLLAEPVGSGTNLVNTVIRPLKEVYADRFTVAPYVALLDPERALEALSGKGRAGFSAKVLYLYKMQQNEADVVAINKVDTLTPERLAEVKSLVEKNFPKAKVMAVSAKTGEGFDEFAAVLDSDAAAGVSAIEAGDLDAATVAEANEQLGWFNATWQITAPGGFDANVLCVDLAGAIQDALKDIAAEPAHVKMILRSGDDMAIANLLSSDRPPELSRRCNSAMINATLVVNCRVEAKSAVLREVVEESVRGISRTCGINSGRTVAQQATLVDE